MKRWPGCDSLIVEFTDNCLKYESEIRKNIQTLGSSCKKFLSKSKGASYIKKHICDKMASVAKKVKTFAICQLAHHFYVQMQPGAGKIEEKANLSFFEVFSGSPPNLNVKIDWDFELNDPQNQEFLETAPNSQYISIHGSLYDDFQCPKNNGDMNLEVDSVIYDDYDL
jgi:hypothetical protein